MLNLEQNLFNSFVADYDRMIDWEQRLKREEPFFKKIFSDNSTTSVLDTACGTGRHAIMFSSWGLDVGASDISSRMISQARENAAAAGRQVDFRVARLAQVDKVFNRKYDVVTCIGNSLPHIKKNVDLLKVFKGASRVTSNRGIYVLQIRNYHRVYERNERFMPLNTRTMEGKEYLYLRTNELGKEFITFNIIVLNRDEKGKWSYRVESEQLKPRFTKDIEKALKSSGFSVDGIYGDIKFGAFEPSNSTDLIIIARKDT